MTITTAIIITVIGLAVYYAATIGYDLYLDHLAKSNSDQSKETAIDISEEVLEFNSIPIEGGSHATEDFSKFEDMICLGVSANKMNQLMCDAAQGTNSKELDNILYTIHQHNQFQ